MRTSADFDDRNRPAVSFPDIRPGNPEIARYLLHFLNFQYTTSFLSLFRAESDRSIKKAVAPAKGQRL